MTTNEQASIELWLQADRNYWEAEENERAAKQALRAAETRLKNCLNSMSSMVGQNIRERNFKVGTTVVRLTWNEGDVSQPVFAKVIELEEPR